MVNMIHLEGPAGSHTSQPDLTMGYNLSDKTRYFSCSNFVTGEEELFFCSRQYIVCKNISGHESLTV
jgi:hypothetical protein